MTESHCRCWKIRQSSPASADCLAVDRGGHPLIRRQSDSQVRINAVLFDMGCPLVRTGSYRWLKGTFCGQPPGSRRKGRTVPLVTQPRPQRPEK